MWNYPVTLKRDDNGTILVGFPDFPEAHTFGDTVENALAHASDALATVIDAYIKDRRDLPDPSEKRSRYHVAVPALVAAKTLMYRIMRDSRVGKAELAKRLDVHLPQVDRLLDVHHGSQVSQLEAAFAALGKRLIIDVEDAPAVKKSSRRGVA
ncbi:MAG: type II toxin-antitoxin system HicB family antitoxin [Acidobacteriota bacterium]